MPRTDRQPLIGSVRALAVALAAAVALPAAAGGGAEMREAVLNRRTAGSGTSVAPEASLHQDRLRSMVGAGGRSGLRSGATAVNGSP